MTATAPVVLNFKALENNSLVFRPRAAVGAAPLRMPASQSHGKFWVGMPAKPYAKPDGSQSWVKIVDFRDKATGYRFQQMIVPLAVEAWQKAEVAA